MTSAGLESLAGAGLLASALALAHQYRPRHWPRAWLLPIMAIGMAAAYLLVGALLVKPAPELTEQRAWVIQAGAGWMVLGHEGTRHTSCEWLHNDAWVIDAEGREHPAVVTYVSVGARGNRLPGRHRFSDRLLVFNEALQPVAVRYASHYRCALWFKRVDSGRLDL